MMDYLGEMTALLQQERARNISSSHKVQLASQRRAKLFADTLPELPFPVAEWPPLRTNACPHDQRVKHGSSERGLMLAHYQILLDFAFFDWDVQEKHDAPGGMADGSIYKGTSYSAESHTFVAVGPNPPQPTTSTGAAGAGAGAGAGLASDAERAAAEAENGGAPQSAAEAAEDARYFAMGPGLYRDGIPFRDDDVLVIFEDDAEIAVKDAANTLIEELNDMKDIDLLYLGWCEGRTARPIPLCAHAYALTRHGARQLIKHFEPCGPAYDWLLVNLIRNKWLRHRTAHTFSYQNNYKPGFHNGATRGIFQQGDKNTASFNHGN
jgi:hypothetical protein